MSTLAEFLLARIAEDEAAVHSLAERGGMTGYPGRCRESRGAEGWDWLDTSDWDDGYRLATTADRVLAECDAKRRIIELHRDAGRSHGDTDTGYGEIDHCCGQCGTLGEYGTPWPCRTVRALALPYADHPDFRAEWRP